MRILRKIVRDFQPLSTLKLKRNSLLNPKENDIHLRHYPALNKCKRAVLSECLLSIIKKQESMNLSLDFTSKYLNACYQMAVST